MTVTLAQYLSLSAILFAIGVAGALTRKNAIIILMSIEIMFNAAILNLVVFWHYRLPLELSPQMLAIFAIAVAAAESAIGLALVISIYRHYRSINVEEMRSLKG